jgi:hypothetical protein
MVDKPDARNNHPHGDRSPTRKIGLLNDDHHDRRPNSRQYYLEDWARAVHEAKKAHQAAMAAIMRGKGDPTAAMTSLATGLIALSHGIQSLASAMRNVDG